MPAARPDAFRLSEPFTTPALANAWISATPAAVTPVPLTIGVLAKKAPSVIVVRSAVKRTFAFESEIAREAMVKGSSPSGNAIPLGPPKHVFVLSLGGGVPVPETPGAATEKVPSVTAVELVSVTALTV